MDFGNGAHDARIFQLDTTFAEFRASKLACRADRLSKYYQVDRYPDEVATAVAAFVARRLAEEHPGYFHFETAADGGSTLDCALTGDRLRFDSAMRLLPGSAYESALDALAMQVCEDLNVLALTPEGDNRLCAMHVCSPSTWRPEEKIGKDFFGIHSPVPKSEALLKAAKGIANAMVFKGPYVRFNWGLTMNPQVNHYPDPPPGVSRVAWRGEPLSSLRPESVPYMWVERQVVWGLPEARASLFTIRVSFNDLREVRDHPVRRGQLVATLQSMGPELLEYKGFDECYAPLLAWLGAPGPEQTSSASLMHSVTT
jgi:hypothetical protein